MSRATTLLLALCATLALAACGGGDWPGEDRKVPPPGVDCKARPELCT